jgi:phage gpG-like protein
VTNGVGTSDLTTALHSFGGVTGKDRAGNGRDVIEVLSRTYLGEGFRFLVCCAVWLL